MPLTLSYTGVVAAEQIKMTGDFMGMPFEFVVNKPRNRRSRTSQFVSCPAD
jgi:hypothetical protein